HQEHPGDPVHLEGPGNRPYLGHATGRARLRRQAGQPGRAARQDLRARLMATRTSLRDYQRELAERLKGAASGRAASKLGLQVGGGFWLVDLADAGEVIAVAPIPPVPAVNAGVRGAATARVRL